jgi:hypothetical protein
MKSFDVELDQSRLESAQDRSYVVMWLTVLEYNLNVLQRTENAQKGLKFVSLVAQLLFFISQLKEIEKYASSYLVPWSKDAYKAKGPKRNRSRNENNSSKQMTFGASPDRPNSPSKSSAYSRTLTTYSKKS